MKGTVETENAKIARTFMGIEDHGILTFFLHMEGEGWCQSFGGYACDSNEGEKTNGFLTTCVRKILHALEVDNWEKLSGKYCRIKRVDGKIDAVGHITKDKWFNIRYHARKAQEMS